MAAKESTDLSKWKLHNDRGRQTWHYSENQSPEEQKFYDRYFLGLDIVRQGGLEGIRAVEGEGRGEEPELDFGRAL